MESKNRITLQKLYSEGITEAKKLSKITNIPLRTVYNFLKRIKNKMGIERQNGSGRKSKFSADDKRRISQIANYHPLLSSARIGELAIEKETPPVHRTTVFRYLKSKGFLKLLPKMVTKLTNTQIQKRIDWCT